MKSPESQGLYELKSRNLFIIRTVPLLPFKSDKNNYLSLHMGKQLIYCVKLKQNSHNIVHKCHQNLWNTISGSTGCERVVVVLVKRKLMVVVWGLRSTARSFAAH